VGALTQRNRAADPAPEPCSEVSLLKAQLVELFRGEVPRVFHDMRATILITMALFLGMGLLIKQVRISGRISNLPLENLLASSLLQSSP